MSESTAIMKTVKWIVCPSGALTREWTRMTHRMISVRSTGRVGNLAAALGLSLLVLPAASARADEVTLAETGSTLLYPLFNVWVSDYTKTHSGVRITTGSTGSSEGIEKAISGAVQIGTSDAYMTDAQAKRNPHIINVLMAISALTVNYNLP
jgi:phosphate transport system substrate-binding protein